MTSPPPSPGVTKYKLADHRYGREEMLVLYNKDLCQKPDVLDEFSTITLEKCQLPLAFLPVTEEEQVRFLPEILPLYFYNELGKILALKNNFDD